MPNWCENELHIFGASEDIKHFMEANKGLPARYEPREWEKKGGYYGTYEQDYLQLTGPVSKIDPYWHFLQIGNTVIDFPEIFELLMDSQGLTVSPAKF